MTNIFTPRFNPKTPNHQDGFSLVELMIVVAIIGIIVTIAVPAYRGYVNTARHAKAKAMLMQLPILMEQYRAESLTGVLCPDSPCAGEDYEEKAGLSEIGVASYLSSFDPVLSADGVDYEYIIDFDLGTNDTATLTVNLKRAGTIFDSVVCPFPQGCDEDD